MSKREPKEKRINEITRAAMDVFLKKGYEGTTMESIAQEAGISKGGLYHHFESKDMILMAVNEKMMEEMGEIILKASQCGSVKEGILYYIEKYILFWIEHPKETSFLFLSLAKVLDNQELLSYYHDYTVDYINYFEEAFTMGIQSGEFIPHNVKTSAITLMAALDGILSYMIFDNSLQLDEVVEHFEEKFIKPVVKSKSI
ncbi:MAG: TetR/AcrR family transcriptional regulator [Methanobacteriaceae archaeon]|jgi:AcrR family transcriptional regulator|nr:TetR/AcrR family transcriptional regulator [Methanobacteriaceae archaeon]MDO9626864.1 TetR/AcrR family transcriptional regulator [Methanobacteriaceae archaeon]